MPVGWRLGRTDVQRYLHTWPGVDLANSHLYRGVDAPVPLRIAPTVHRKAELFPCSGSFTPRTVPVYEVLFQPRLTAIVRVHKQQNKNHCTPPIKGLQWFCCFLRPLLSKRLYHFCISSSSIVCSVQRSIVSDRLFFRSE